MSARRDYAARYRLARTLAADGTAIPGEDPTVAECVDTGRDFDRGAAWMESAALNRGIALECRWPSARRFYLDHARACLSEAAKRRGVWP